MDRGDFLWVSASAWIIAAVAGTSPVLSGGPAVFETQKGGGRALISEPVVVSVSSGTSPFALSRFATDGSLVSASKSANATALPVLSPMRDVSFHGFSGGAEAFADDHIQVVAVHHTTDGITARHDLWSHTPVRSDGTSGSVLFTALDDAFAGFEITHMPAVGSRTSGLFGFAASGARPVLKPGVYVLADPSAATGAAPDLARYAYSGDLRAPARKSRVLGLDFAYLSFVVHGEWL
ncbi:MAG: hypothetical protein H7203_14995 [Rhizobacter sp.]|nr:hypothetical protein [Burkholderiales bacterium]